MKRRKYYGVAGSNGYGVYDNYDRVLKSRPFVTAFTVKKFKDFDEAKVFALDEYDRLQDGELGSYEIEDINEKNWFYRRKPINRYAGITEYAPDVKMYMGFFETDINNIEDENDVNNIEEKIKPFSIGMQEDTLNSK